MCTDLSGRIRALARETSNFHDPFAVKVLKMGEIVICQEGSILCARAWFQKVGGTTMIIFTTHKSGFSGVSKVCLQPVTHSQCTHKHVAVCMRGR